MKKRLPFASLAPGMALAEALRREDGILLLPRGTVLSPRHLGLFTVWGVAEALVVWDEPQGAAMRRPETPAPAMAVAPAAPDAPAAGAEGPPASAARPCPDKPAEDLAAVREALLPRFAHADLRAPAMAALFALCLPRAARILGRRGPGSLLPAGPLPPEQLPPAPGSPAPEPMELIESDPKLTSLPDVFVRINEVLNDPNSTAKAAAEAIGKDTGLSAKLLKVVNSAFYGFPVKVDTLSRAVTIVGSRQITTLALGLSVISVFKDLPEGFVDMRSFWKHSIGCGIIASTLADPEAEIDAERLFVAGLLHDVGRLVLYRCLPRHAAHVLGTARAEGILLREAEQRLLGFDHAALGGMLLCTWRFPESLERAVRHHHGGGAVFGLPMPAMVHVADVIANALVPGSSGEVFVPPIAPAAWNTVGLPPKRLADVVAVADSQIEDIIKAFLPDDE